MKRWFASWRRAAPRVAVLVGLLVFGSAVGEVQAQPEPQNKPRAKTTAKAKAKPKAKVGAKSKAKIKRSKQRGGTQAPPPVVPEPPEVLEPEEEAPSVGEEDSGQLALPPVPDSGGETEGAAGGGEPQVAPGLGSNEPALPPGLDSGGTSPAAVGSSEPALPAGLGSGGESPGTTGRGDPALPPGLSGDSAGSGVAAGGGPALPPGLGGPIVSPGLSAGDTPVIGESSPSILEVLGLTGFLDLRNGVRVQDDPHQPWTTLAEVRLQLSLEQSFLDRLTFKATSDFLLDSVAEEDDIDLRRGRGPIDLREASLSYTPFDFLDLKLGRQTLTWGTADFVFLNDLFPKDFEAFFLGRDMRYLKAPSDALKTSIYTPIGNLDVVLVPRFNPDRFITGERLSYFNPQLMQLAGQNAIIEAEVPDDWIEEGELHARFSLNAGSVELAAYGYRGYWKSPGGFDMNSGRATFPRLNVFGASFRDKLFSGLTNIEVAYYHSLEDTSGDNFFVNNSEARFLVGYERQFPSLAEDLTFWAQYYLEFLPHYDAYLGTLPEGFPARDEFRHLITLRITKLLLGQNMTASLVTVYSPSDRDGYVNPSIGYKVADCCSVTAGGNFFFGDKDYTFFYQLQNNANAYAGVQYGF